MIQDCLKIGLLSPDFKNKGNPSDAGNYREITVLPVLIKIIESVIRNRIQNSVIKSQNPIQGGFTKGESSLNAA